MYICDERTFEELVSQTPELCAWGLGSDSICRFDSVFFRANRLLLLNSYREFVMCCTWLREQCAVVKAVSAKSPTSRQLQRMANSHQYVGHGAMIAAILYMGFPYKADPHSPWIQAGISLNSPCFRSVQTLSEHSPLGKKEAVSVPPSAKPGYPVKRKMPLSGSSRHARLPFSAGL